MTSSPRHPLPMAATGCACCAPTSVPEEAGTAVEAQSPSSDGTARSTKPRLPQNATHSIPPQDPAGWPGGHRKVDTPDPIPNSAVKHLSAHGTVAQATGESVAAGPPSRILHSPVIHTPPRGGAAR